MSDRISMPIQSNNSLAMERAKLSRFIAAVFSEPDADLIERIEDPAIQEELRAAVSAIGIDKTLIDMLLTSMTDHGVIAESCNLILGHTVRSDCPPYELEYRTSEIFQQSQTLADIAGFYRAFGFTVAGPLPEREDHVATQWEFLAALSMKLTLARCDEDVACCRDAQKAFLSDHAAMWMPAMFERIRKADATSFLARTADLAEAVLRHWCEELEVKSGPRWLELRPITEEDSSITCGASGGVELGPVLAAAMDERA